MRNKWIPLLTFWFFGILFPMAWLGNFSTGYRQVFNSIFAPEWMHWLMHAVLFAGLVTLVVLVFNLQLKFHTVLLLLWMVLFVGMAQEGTQLLSQRQIFRWNSLFDLAVDLFGGVIGLGIIWGIRKVLGYRRIPRV
jgi:hypothetical protein